MVIQKINILDHKLVLEFSLQTKTLRKQGDGLESSILFDFLAKALFFGRILPGCCCFNSQFPPYKNDPFGSSENTSKKTTKKTLD